MKRPRNLENEKEEEEEERKKKEEILPCLELLPNSN